MKISSKILESKSRIYYGLAGFRSSRDVTKEVLKIAYKSGCRWLYVGVESLSQRMLNLMSKGLEVNHTLKVIRWCNELGINLFSSYIWGFPLQTEEEIKKEALLCRRYKNFLSITDDGMQFALYKGSKVSLFPHKYGIKSTWTPTLFKTESGKVKNTRMFYLMENRLSPTEARRLFRKHVHKSVSYELSGYWEHLLILASRKVRLRFLRQKYPDCLDKFAYRMFLDACKAAAKKSDSSVRGRDYFNLGVSNEYLQNYHEAVRAFLLSRKKSRDKIMSCRINFHLGIAYAGLGDYTKAAEVYRRGLVISGGNMDKDSIYIELVKAYYNQRRYRKAVGIARKIISPNYLNNLRFILGCCYKELKQYKSGLREFQEALQFSKDEPKINFLLAECFEGLKQKKEAKAQFREGLVKLRILKRAKE